jgi:hypothetical protein
LGKGFREVEEVRGVEEVREVREVEEVRGPLKLNPGASR